MDEINLTENTVKIPQSETDQNIQNKLTKIFEVTGWYPQLKIDVREGIVVLRGNIEKLEHRDWAFKLVEKTDGVIAWVDHLETKVIAKSVLAPATTEVSDFYEKASRQVPYILSGIFLLFIFIVLALFMKKLVSRSLARKFENRLLIRTGAGAAGIIVTILGIYFALKASGLSTLAVSLLGGTGMLGIGLGLALKNTFENYTSSLMISFKEILKIGELVDINGFEGIVQSVTTRGTTLMDLEGNNILIPNALVFNSVIKNLTRNPLMRSDFIVGIGYDDSIDQARLVIEHTLDKLSPYVLAEPPPVITVDSLGAATVNLKIYFWLDAVKSSRMKVRSMVIQNVKEALMAAQISLPDDAREIVFANALKVVQEDSASMIPIEQGKNKTDSDPNILPQLKVKESKDLKNEVNDIKEQAAKAAPLEKGENLVAHEDQV